MLIAVGNEHLKNISSESEAFNYSVHSSYQYQIWLERGLIWYHFVNLPARDLVDHYHYHLNDVMHLANNQCYYLPFT